MNPQNFSTIHLPSHRPASAQQAPLCRRGPCLPAGPELSMVQGRQEGAQSKRYFLPGKPRPVAWELHNFVRREQTCRIAEAIYYFSSRFFAILKSANPPKIIRKIMNKFDKAKSLMSRPIPYTYQD